MVQNAAAALRPDHIGRSGVLAVTAADLQLTITAAAAALRPGAELDWSRPAGGLRWDCRRTAIHLADDLVAYAGQLAGQVVGDYLPFEIRVPRTTEPSGLITLIEGLGALMVAAVRSAPPGARGHHPVGMCEPAQFAALALAEVVLHTHDLATGLGLEWKPPPGTAGQVLDQLFPGVDPEEESEFDVLLWATGRQERAEREPVKRWRYQLLA